MDEIWNQFSEGTKDATSIIRIANVNSNINSQTNLTKIALCFKDVISRPLLVQNDYTPPKNQKLNFDYKFSNLKNKNFKMYETDNEATSKNKDIFVSLNQNITTTQRKKEKDDEEEQNEEEENISNILDYSEKVPKIVSCKVDKDLQKDFSDFIHKSINDSKNKKNFRSQIETILMNEKQKSNDNFGITIVIDASISCFNFIGSIHSIKTVLNILVTLSLIKIPFIDIILATEKEPVVLCCDVPSNKALGEKSSIWPALFSYLLQNDLNDTDLEAALQASIDLRKMKSNDFSNYLFVLTDGLYMVERKEKIKEIILKLTRLLTKVIGIGIGMYPLGITDIFENSVFAPNPDEVIQAISCCFDKENKFPLDKISPLLPDIDSCENILSILNKYEDFNKYPVFRGLKEELMNIQAGMDAFKDVYNEEQEFQEKSYEKIPKCLLKIF